MMSSRAFAVAAAVLGLAFCGVLFSVNRSSPVVLRTNLENLPLHITGYQGRDDHFSAAIVRELNTDTYVYRHYADRQGDWVSLYIGYYGTAKGGRTGHNPYACLPGSGWAILETDRVTLTPFGEAAKPVEVNYILAGKDGSYETVLHWYQVDGDKVISTGIEQNIQRFWGRVLHNRNDGAFVRVTVLSNDQELEAARIRARSFAEQLLALLPRYWPEEG